MKHFVQNPDGVSIKSYASLVLLHRVYSNMEKRRFTKARREFLREQLHKHGKLTCAYCGRSDFKLKAVKKNLIATIDHIKPVALGGDHFDKNNFATCCAGCNRRKGTTSAESFVESKYIKKKRV